MVIQKSQIFIIQTIFTVLFTVVSIHKISECNVENLKNKFRNKWKIYIKIN